MPSGGQIGPERVDEEGKTRLGHFLGDHGGEAPVLAPGVKVIGRRPHGHLVGEKPRVAPALEPPRRGPQGDVLVEGEG